MSSPQSNPEDETARHSFNDVSKDGVEKQSPQLQAVDEGDANNTDELQNPYFTDAVPSQNAGKKLPTWLDHFNAKDLKKLFKCSMAVWLQTILIFINPTLKVMGGAAFVGCILLVIVPPSGNLFFQLLAYASVLIGLGLGWAWGVIVMKAAQATRPASETQALLAQLQSMAEKSSNPTEFVQTKIFQGYMLDTRVTITYFCMIGVFIYLIARLRVAAPKLAPVQMFACIISIVFLTEAPLLPTFDGTLAKVIAIPVSIAAGIGLVCNVLFFPVSASSQMLDGMYKLLSPMPVFLDACLLAFKHPHLSMNVPLLLDAKSKVAMGHKAMEPSTIFLPIDVSINRWSPGDLAALGEPLVRVITSFIGLVEAHSAKEEHREKDLEALRMLEATYNEHHSSKPASQPGHHQMNHDVDFRTKARHPNRDEMMEKSFHALAASSESLLDSCKESIAAASEAIADSNAFSWQRKNQSEKHQQHVDVLNRLRLHRDNIAPLLAQNLLESHQHLFNKDGSLKMEDEHFPPVNGLMMALLFEDRLLQLANSLEKLLSGIVHLESTRTKSRLWLPKSIMAIFRWASEPDDLKDYLKSADTQASSSTIVPESMDTPPNDKPDNDPTQKSAKEQLASMRRPNNHKRGKGGQIMLSMVNWFASDESIFALRLLVVTIALSVPAVIDSSANFFNLEKGLWAVIMSQLALAPYSGDLVYGIIVRTVGTIVGGVIGMAAWYIGAGNGPGNPYGMAAISAVVIIIFMWLRLFTPPSVMPAGIMMASTSYLVVGYGWIDTHLPAYGNPGVGYSIFWRRLVLVFVGFAATVIVSFLPRPPSANRHYRGVLADSIASARDRYALFASNWSNPAPDLRQIAEQEAVEKGEILLSIVGPIRLTLFEFSTSDFDAASLGRICQLCTSLNHNITQLLLCTADVPSKHHETIVPATGAVNEDLVAELMAVLSLAQQALKSSDPLPAVIPTPLFARAVAFARQQVREGKNMHGLFRSDNLGGEGMRKYIVFTNTLMQTLSVVDGLILELKRAVGETSDMVLIQTV